ncbi:MAG TPA: asparagine synthase (glutamine-hydrolyzing) [Myxococcota bacterium]|nr:asparagine synthase (glutamine-hydrolyzing) [Myxococcota bacterium]
MCGIAGIYHPDGRAADPAPLGPMLDRIAHRGPDGRGTWHHGPCALGHVRLAVLDRTERAHQPMVVGDGRGVLAYNGEVYNFARLRAELEAEGARFTSTGDAQVVAEALLRWGPERAVRRFDGMFAFAWLDRREGALWLARDPLGIKPLVLTRRGDALIFCSEPKGLLAHPDVPADVDPRELHRFLVLGRGGPERSILRGVELLPPGALWRVEGRREEQRRFFDLVEIIRPPRLARRGAAVARASERELEDGLEQSVAGCLQSDAPLAALCSGGVDSSLVTALAAPRHPGLEAWVADVGHPSEADAARRVGRHLGVSVHAVPLGREAYLRLWPEAVHHEDAPCRHPSSVPLLAVARACRQAGIAVLLTGEGADELFGGYPRYAHAHDLVRQARLARRIPGPLGRPARLLAHWLRGVEHPRVPAAFDPRIRRRIEPVLAPESHLRRQALAAHLGHAVPPAEKAAHLLALDDLFEHLGWILSRHDRIGMAASIETRLPFLVRGLIALGLELPYGLKQRRGEPKWLLRRVARRHLPDGIVSARKRGFPVDSGHHAGSAALLRGGRVPELVGWTRAVADEMVPQIERSSLRFHYVSLEIWARLRLGGESTDSVAEALAKAASRPRPGRAAHPGLR